MGKNMVVLLPMEEAYREKLRALTPGWELYFWEDVPRQEWPLEVLRETEVFLGNPPRSAFAKCPELKWVQLNSAGADAYTQPGLMAPGAQLTNATGAYGHAIAEHMVGVVFELFKNLHLYRDNQRTGDWRDRGQARSVQGAQVLVVGMGDIGGQFAQKMHLLGAGVWGVRRTPHPAPDYVEGLFLQEDLDRLLPQADIVALALPNTPQTAGLMDRRRLGLMKQDAVLLNVGRGSAVDTDALVEELRSGHLAGAGLDVTDPEPLPPDHPLWRQENAVITPHISGGYHLRHTYEAIMGILLRNVEAFLAGRPLENPVDFETGYKKNA